MTAFAPLRCARTPKLDLLARRARAAHRGFARREREQIDAGEQVPARLQLRHGQTTAVAEKEEGIRFVARPELEVAGDVHHRRPLTELGP